MKSISENTRKSFYLFLLTVFLWCLFYGGVKFLMKNVSKEFYDIDPGILLENLAGFLSIGAMVAYIVGGSITNMFTKRRILLTITAVVIIILLFEFLFGLANYPLLAASMIVTGFGYGTFAILRTIITYIEIVKTKLPDTTVNGLATITFVFAIILGVFLSTLLFEHIENHVFWVFIGILVLSMIPVHFLRYEKFEHHRSFSASFQSFLTDAKWVFRRKSIVLLASAALWSIATVVSLKSIPYSMDKFGVAESQSSLVLLCSSIGVILGNAITVRVKNRWLLFRIFSYFFAFLIFFFVQITLSFPLVVAYSLMVGLSMGAATNLVDSHYLSFVGNAHKKENGAAIQGFMINFAVAFLFFSLHAIPDEYDFYVMGVIVVICTLLIRLNLDTIEQK